jgi:hypothetical protein
MNDSETNPSTENSPLSSSSQTSAFERWRRKAALVTGIGVTEEERLSDLRDHQIRGCEKMKMQLMNYSQSAYLEVFLATRNRLTIGFPRWILCLNQVLLLYSC